jgi:hypothetical protein
MYILNSGLPVGDQLDEAAHDFRKDEVHDGWTVPSGCRADLEPRVSLRNGGSRPGFQRVEIREAAVLELFCRVGSGYYRQRVFQLAFCYLVEVVAMEVGEKHHVDGWQVLDVHRGICLPGRMKPSTEGHLLVHMNKVGIGQDGESGVSNEHRRVADKKDRAPCPRRQRAAGR